MKILHINCNYIFSALHQNLIEKLNTAGISNDVFVATYDKTKSIVEIGESVRVEECFKKWNRLLFDFKQHKILKAIENSYMLKEFDCIHAYTLFTDGNSAMKLSKKYSIPYVVAIRNTDVNDFFAKRILLRRRGIEIMRNAQKIFFLSETYKSEILKYVPEKYKVEIAKKSVVIPNGIDDFWHKHRPIRISCNVEKKCLRLIYAGRIDKNKNILTIQKAMKLLKEKGYNSNLLVIGKIDDQKEFRKIVEDAAITYKPPMPKEKLIYEYRSSDIFVMPSFTESFGLVYAEAISQGLPVIYTEGQGFDGQFEEGCVGYHVSSSDPLDICNKIILIKNNYDVFFDSCINASEKFTWEKLAQEYIEIYKNICGEIKVC